jgi:hypothetical protein
MFPLYSQGAMATVTCMDNFYGVCHFSPLDCRSSPGTDAVLGRVGDRYPLGPLKK